MRRENCFTLATTELGRRRRSRSSSHSRQRSRSGCGCRNGSGLALLEVKGVTEPSELGIGKGIGKGSLDVDGEIDGVCVADGDISCQLLGEVSCERFVGTFRSHVGKLQSCG